MIKLTRLIILMCISVGVFGHAYSADISKRDGNSLINACQVTQKIGNHELEASYEHLMSSGWCLGTIETARDIIGGLSEGRFLPIKLGACMPEKGITNEQTIRIVLHYLEDNPQKLHLPASILSTFALSEAFPCDPTVYKKQ